MIYHFVPAALLGIARKSLRLLSQCGVVSGILEFSKKAKFEEIVAKWNSQNLANKNRNSGDKKTNNLIHGKKKIFADGIENV